MDDPVIFLDIDGVLNDHGKLPSGYCGITLRHATLFNEILVTVPDAKIVISSAWRYLILRGEMTVKGFEYLLMVHGVTCQNRVVGHTIADADICKEPGHFDYEAWKTIGLQMRHEQISRFVAQNGIRQYAVLDDLPLSIPNLIQTDGKVGLTSIEVSRVIAMLRRYEF